MFLFIVLSAAGAEIACWINTHLTFKFRRYNELSNEVNNNQDGNTDIILIAIEYTAKNTSKFNYNPSSY